MTRSFRSDDCATECRSRAGTITRVATRFNPRGHGQNVKSPTLRLTMWGLRATTGLARSKKGRVGSSRSGALRPRKLRSAPRTAAALVYLVGTPGLHPVERDRSPHAAL